MSDVDKTSEKIVREKVVPKEIIQDKKAQDQEAVDSALTRGLTPHNEPISTPEYFKLLGFVVLAGIACIGLFFLYGYFVY